MMDQETRAALVGNTLMRLVSQVLTDVKNNKDSVDPAAGLDKVMGALDHISTAQDALDALYVRGEMPAGLEDEAARLFSLADWQRQRAALGVEGA